MEHLKEISQKPRMRLFGADNLKIIFQVSFSKLYYEQGCMLKELPGRCFDSALSHFWLDILRLFLDVGVQNCPVITFNISNIKVSLNI